MELTLTLGVIVLVVVALAFIRTIVAAIVYAAVALAIGAVIYTTMPESREYLDPVYGWLKEHVQEVKNIDTSTIDKALDKRISVKIED